MKNQGTQNTSESSRSQPQLLQQLQLDAQQRINEDLYWITREHCFRGSYRNPKSNHLTKQRQGLERALFGKDQAKLQEFYRSICDYALQVWKKKSQEETIPFPVPDIHLAKCVSFDYILYSLRCSGGNEAIYCRYRACKFLLDLTEEQKESLRQAYKEGLEKNTCLTEQKKEECMKTFQIEMLNKHKQTKDTGTSSDDSLTPSFDPQSTEVQATALHDVIAKFGTPGHLVKVEEVSTASSPAGTCSR